MAINDNIESYPVPLIEFSQYKTTYGCSPKTISEYLLDWRTFCRYLKCKREGTTELLSDPDAIIDISGLGWDFFNTIKESEIYEFITYVANNRSNGNAAKARKLSAIRSFYKYATVKVKKIENNPAQNIESPKKTKKLPKHLSLEESVELLTAVKNDKSNPNSVRDFCILTLFLNCGMRLSELCGISLSDIDRELKSLRVLGKGSKERVVYLNDACKNALLLYLPIRQKATVANKNETALFLSRLGKRISNKTVQWLVKKHLGEAGLEYKHYSTHKLRHTAATLMYQTGEVDIRVLKDILGHEQLSTTQIYTHVSDKNMEEAMTHNPLANVEIKQENKDEDED